MTDAKTTLQVIVELGVTRDKILKAIQRHPHLAPGRLFGNKNFLWTAAEIQAMQSHLSNAKRGRPAK